MFFDIEVALVCAPVIGIKARNAERFEVLFELCKDLIFSSAKDISENGVSGMVYGIPKPAWVRFTFNKRPLFIEFSLESKF